MSQGGEQAGKKTIIREIKVGRQIWSAGFTAQRSQFAVQRAHDGRGPIQNIYVKNGDVIHFSIIFLYLPLLK